jgi:hypothetical protein
MKMFRTIAAVLPLIMQASGAMAASFSGNWKVTVSQSQHLDGTYCLTLVDNGGVGWPHSGEASIAGQPYGTFQVIDGTLMATIQEPGDTGQSAGLVFIGRTSGTHIGKGTTLQVYGGEEFNSGVASFGKKGSC